MKFSLIFLLSVLSWHTSSAQVKVKTYFDKENKNLKEEYTVTDTISNQLTGSYFSYYQHGQLKSRGNFAQNQPEGLWEYYYENGNLKMKGEIANNQYNGFWSYYYEHGGKSMEGRISEGQREGDWKFYYENGTLKSHGQYIAGEKEGPWKFYFEDGSIKAKAFYENNSGPYREFYPSGEIYVKGFNKNGQSDSLWTYYYEDGLKKAEGRYQDGVKEGIWQYHHPNSKLSAEGSFKNGQKTGKWVYYHTNGNVSSEGAVHNGQRDGYWKLFHQDGSFKGEIVLQEGDGEYKEFYQSGKLRVKGNILHGKNHGKWYYYTEDGLLEGEAVFEEGEGHYTGFYKDGSVRMKGLIKDGENVGVWQLFEKNGELAGYYRPYYKEQKPIFRIIEQKSDTIRESPDYLKPEYRYRKRSLRYFTPRINEYNGLIVSGSPVAIAFGSLPISIEYFIQDRLGHELQYTILRDPFLTSSNNVPLNSVYERGFSIAFRQKFYHPETSMGSFYFGHELRYSNINHSVNMQDHDTNAPFILDGFENLYEYSILLGNRWIKFFGDKWMNNADKTGITVDLYTGLGIGYRNYHPKYSPNHNFLFENIHQKSLSIPFRLGFNLGYVF